MKQKTSRDLLGEMLPIATQINVLEVLLRERKKRWREARKEYNKALEREKVR